MIFLQFDSVTSEASNVYSTLELSLHIFAAIFGLIGGLRVYNQWQLHGRHVHIDKQIVWWFGASLFFLCADQFISDSLL